MELGQYVSHVTAMIIYW